MRKKIQAAGTPGAAVRGFNLVLDFPVWYWPPTTFALLLKQGEHAALIRVGVELTSGREQPVIDARAGYWATVEKL
jgi:hypothetical protein